MGDAIKPAGAPGSSEDVGSRPDVGFHDDHVGGHLKAEEAAKRRAAQGVMQRRPRRIEVEPEQVGEVRHFRGTQEDPAARQSNRQQRGLVAGQGPTRKQVAPRRAGGVPPAIDADVQRIEERVDTLMETLLELERASFAPKAAGEAAREAAAGEQVEREVLALITEDERAALDGAKGRAPEPRALQGRAPARRRRVTRDGDHHDDAQDGEGGEGNEAPVLEAFRAAEDDARWQRAARDMRFLLQHLVAGGIGLTLAADPEVTFRRLFDGLAAWPTGVPPGRRPRGAADYDAFLAWVFRPDDPTGVLHALAAAAGDASGL